MFFKRKWNKRCSCGNKKWSVLVGDDKSTVCDKCAKEALEKGIQ